MKGLVEVIEGLVEEVMEEVEAVVDAEAVVVRH